MDQESSEPFIQDNNNTLYVDCDDTMILWDRSKYPDLPTLSISTPAGTMHVKLHQKNKNVIEKFAKMRYDIIFWSGSGGRHAYEVAKALSVNAYSNTFLSKPRYILDDQPPEQWHMERIWRKPSE